MAASLALLCPLLLAGSASAKTSIPQELREQGLLEAHEQGMGRDLRIAILEQAACIARDHVDFSFLTFETRSPDEECDPVHTGVSDSLDSDHSTQVTSALASARPDGQGGYVYRGPFAGRFFDIDSNVFLSHAAGTELSERDPDFVNISETTKPESAKWIDQLVYEKRIFVANAAGNDTADYARCYAYNALCVGGYDHGNTESWIDDTSTGGASWKNHPATGREEPDLVGVTNVRLLAQAQHASARDPNSGTSFAAPSVVGLAALLTANHPQVLRREPTLLRALLMASASHPVREPEKIPGIPIVGDGVDDRTGAGVPRGDRASAIVEGKHLFARRLDRARDFDAAGRLGDPIGFQAGKGDVVRAVLAWDSCPAYQNGASDTLVVDLDLTVRGPDHDGHDDILCCADVNLSSMQVYEATRRSSYTATDEGADGSYPTELDHVDESVESGSEGYDQSYLMDVQRILDMWRLQLEPPRLLSQFDFLDDRAKQDTADVSDEVASGIESDSSLDFQRLPTVFTNHSRVDNYEIVEFRAPIAGTYEIEVDARRWEVCPFDGERSTHTALAWDVWKP